MKITVNVDCTPEEARAFLGLPDLKPLQDVFIAQLSERLTTHIEAFNPDLLFRSWLPGNLTSFEQLTKTMLEAMFSKEPK